MTFTATTKCAHQAVKPNNDLPILMSIIPEPAQVADPSTIFGMSDSVLYIGNASYVPLLVPPSAPARSKLSTDHQSIKPRGQMATSKNRYRAGSSTLLRPTMQRKEEGRTI
jgi:hypothetical protein